MPTQSVSIGMGILQEIAEYQKTKRIENFSAAVSGLCKLGLKNTEIVEELENLKAELSTMKAANTSIQGVLAKIMAEKDGMQVSLNECSKKYHELLESTKRQPGQLEKGGLVSEKNKKSDKKSTQLSRSKKQNVGDP